MSGRIIPSIGEPPTPLSFDSALELSCHLSVSFSLQIGDQGSVVSGECNLLSSVSSQQKFEAKDIKALGASQLLDRPCYTSWVSNRPCYIWLLGRSALQLCVTAQFYLENSREIHR